ncbi:MAG: universal stress protein [Terriglobales bacterium]
MATATKLILSLKVKNILFATDFSPCSEAAVPYLRALAGIFGATVHVAHVISPETTGGVSLEKFPELDQSRKTAEERMAKFLVKNPLHGVTHHVVVERGPLWHVLTDMIAEHEIDLIILGTHGRRGLKKLLLGSVAEEVFRRAKCPVITVGPATPHDGAGECKLERILYATDFSTGSLQALPFALTLAKECGKKLILLHVLPQMTEIPGTELDAIAEATRQRLQQLLSPGVSLWCQADARVMFGSPAEAILQVAQEDKADLIVMGARHARMNLVGATVSAHLPWATAHRVVCEAHCPVLTVRS